MHPCEDCGADLPDRRARWHRWCGPARTTGRGKRLPIAQPEDTVAGLDMDQIDRWLMIQLHRAHHNRDGHLFARLAHVAIRRHTGDTASSDDEQSGIQQVLELIGPPVAA